MFLKGKQPCNKNKYPHSTFLPVNMHLKKYFKGKMYVLLLYNKCSENSRAQIVFRTDIFQKLTLGAPDYSDEEFISNDLNKTLKTHLSWLLDNVLHSIREHFSMTSVTSILKHKCSHKFNTPILSKSVTYSLIHRAIACERQTFLLVHRRWGTFRE